MHPTPAPASSSLWLTYRRTLIIAVHLVLWTLAFAVAFLLRFEFSVEQRYLQLGLQTLPLLLGLRVLAFAYRRLFHGLWRYTGAPDLVNLFVATTASSLFFVLGTVLLGYRGFPRSIFVIEWLLAITSVGGVRFGIRKLRELAVHASRVGERKRLLVVGAGDAGEMLLRDIQKTHAARYEVVGFVDDDIRKRGASIHGVRVLGSIEEVSALVQRYSVDEIAIAVPTATRAQMRRILDHCKPCGIHLRTIPGIDSLLDGRVSLNQLRDVAIDDVLGREPVQLDMLAISDFLRGKRVMITGAGGSIGSELCRQVCRFAPSALILVEQAENHLFEINRELGASHPDQRLVPSVADICDSSRLAQLFATTRPEVVLHAAAHKHVPMMELNPGEAIKNNVFGTKKLADLADQHGVDRFVMISTDKAVNPTSVMGASKRVAELYIQALSSRSKTRFVTVRFGNVLGSSGSVIPIFQEQIRRGGPVTVTHPEMKRYFMTIPEACQLVLQAGTMGEGGEIFVLDMGEPVKIVDLARDLITLSGLVPGEDIEIEFSGVRPGEKLFEELTITGENADKTKHPKIFVGRSRPSAIDEVERGLQGLQRVTNSTDPAEVRSALRRVVPEYTPTLPVSVPPPVVEEAQRPDADVILLRR